MDAAAALSLYLYLQQLYDLGTPIHLTISLSCSHQPRPRMPAITRLAALRRRMPGRSNVTTAAALQVFPGVTDMNRRSASV